MNEDDAKARVLDRFGTGAVEKLQVFSRMVEAESVQQNLIAASTLPHIWARHIVDSAQLLAWDQPGPWLDVGTGAGFPGMVIAALRGGVTMVEPRRRRVAFLQSCLEELELTADNQIVPGRVEALEQEPFAVISARAVSALPAFLAAASHCATNETSWLLPKGQNAAAEVAEARRTWHGVFHVEHSITDPDSLIVIAKGVRRR